MRYLAAIFVGALLVPQVLAGTAPHVIIEVRPSAADRRITRFDEPNYITYRRDVGPAAPVVVFLPGTAGQPGNVRMLLSVVADQGYRVIGLEYNDEPAVVQVCLRSPAADCPERFRARRIFGLGDTADIDDRPWESIVNRLVSLLLYLNEHDGQAWGGYLVGGQPDWEHIVVSGFSQGAGMAAYIAKRQKLRRVVLFSGPWDSAGPSREPAPWFYRPGATPASRWFAEYQRREDHASQLASAYRALEIPTRHVLVFELGVAGRLASYTSDPFHKSTVRLPAYAQAWRTMFGRADATGIQRH
jgi:dienelactone hydrolase